MKALIIFTIATAAVLIIAIPLLLGLTLRSIPGNPPPTDDRVLVVDSEHVVEQTFTATKDNLTEIGISIKNPNLTNKDPLIFNLMQNNQTVRSLTISGANVPDGEVVNFKFVPIADSQNQSYQIVLSAPQTTQNPLEPFISNNTVGSGVLTFNGKVVPGTLSFVPFYRVGNPVLNSLTIFSNFFAQLAQDPVFAGVFTIISLVLAGLLLLA